jgi:hypothetical protein
MVVVMVVMVVMVVRIVMFVMIVIVIVTVIVVVVLVPCPINRGVIHLLPPGGREVIAPVAAEARSYITMSPFLGPLLLVKESDPEQSPTAHLRRRACLMVVRVETNVLTTASQEGEAAVAHDVRKGASFAATKWGHQGEGSCRSG